MSTAASKHWQPYAFSVHFKDQALAEYADGFLLGDIPLGQGSFDLTRMMGILLAKKPELKFSLEVITRDALKVPCLTDDYWKSVADASGSDLRDHCDSCGTIKHRGRRSARCRSNSKSKSKTKTSPRV